MRRSPKIFFSLSLSALLAACGSNPQPPDGCEGAHCVAADAGGESTDGGADAGDGLDAGEDAGLDAGHDDAGIEDAGVDGGLDAGSDAGTDAGVDAGMPVSWDETLASQQIDAVRQAIPGSFSSLPIDAALVTYVKPQVGGDTGGFFLQGRLDGPAIFVPDSAGLGTPAVGDVVKLTVKSKAVVNKLTLIGSYLDFATLGSGVPVAPYIQDVSSATDLVSNLDDYESEILAADGTLARDMSGGVAGHRVAELDTAGISGNFDLELRVPTTVRDALDLTGGCSVSISGSPMWRDGLRAQIAAGTAGEITVHSCPAPEVVSAAATSATTVEIVFDRQLEPASLSGPSLFTFDNGLFASAVTLIDPNTVEVTTNAQTPRLAYSVSVGSGLTDTRSTPIASSANSASFAGFVPVASLLITEVNPNMILNKDLIELVATKPGTIKDYRLKESGNSTNTVATLPDLDVAQGDVILVHLQSGSGPTETTAKNQFPAASNPDYSDTAWDVASGGSSLGGSFSRVLRLEHPDGSTTVDAIPFAGSGTPTSIVMSVFNSLRSSGLWVATCASTTCTETEMKSQSVDWTGVGSSFNDSVQRSGTTDTNAAADWAVVTGQATFGAVP